MASFLSPTLDDDAALCNNIYVLMSTNMEFFQHSFDGVVDLHIKHEFYDDMSMCSKVASIEIKIIAAETMYIMIFNNAFYFTTITTQIPLGIQLKDENKTEDMVEIMAELQQYVPMVEVLKDVYVPNIDKTVQVVETLSHPIEFAGDQRTAARGRGAQKAKTHESSLSGRLAGFSPCCSRLAYQNKTA